MNRCIIEKWGGTSLATAERDRKALEHTINTHITEIKKNDHSYTILVPSGPGKTDNTKQGRKATDHAYDIINHQNREKEWIILEDILRRKVAEHSLPQNIIDHLIGEVRSILLSNNLTPEAEAKIIGLPERAEAKILFNLGQCLHPEINFVLLDYHENGMIGKAMSINRDVPIDHESTLHSIVKTTKENQLNGKIAIIPGFIGIKKGTTEMVTLERGMSDGTATYYGATLYADEVRIFSDQNGILPVDPDIIDGSKPISELTYKEAEAFAGLGAKIINEVALRPARERGILIRILNSFNFTQTGTNIRANLSTEHYGVKAIAHVPGYELITVNQMPMNQKGIAAKVASLFERYDLSIDSESDGDSCKTYAVIPNDNTSKLRNELATLGHRTSTINCMVRIALIGEGMDYIPHTNAKTADQILLETLKKQNIAPDMYNLARESVIRSFFLPQEYTHQIITHLYRAFEFHRN